jgi:protein-S-isoprenylcysteine O-methyltransferase Ste14
MTMDRTLIVRLTALYVPAMLVVLAWALRAPRKIDAVAALLACAWSVWSLLLANVLAIHERWWSFAGVEGAVAGVPADLLLGWVLLWGAVPVLLLPRAPLWLVVVLLTVLDLLVMPLAEPILHLEQRWWIGEAAAIVLALIPAQLFARWTVNGKRLGMRATMQAASFGVLVLWVVPELVLERTGGAWTHFLATWQRWGALPLQLALLPALIGVSAVQEFVDRGLGTPVPFDPPRRLVTSGAYAYVANPMQLSIALLLTGWGVLAGSWWMMLAGPMAVVYGCGLAAWDEATSLGGRFGAPWHVYRRHVRAWIPRLRPFHASDVGDAQPARLYVAASCGPCSEVAAWFRARRPRGLEVMPAEWHPSRDLWRITYDPCDGSPDEQGIVAVARALEHVHLGWAVIGWTMRMPLVRGVLQLLVDASGGEPRLIKRTAAALEVRTCPR